MRKVDIKRMLATLNRHRRLPPLLLVTLSGISTRAGVGGRRGRKRRRAEVKAWWRTAKAGLLKMAARA